MGSRAHRQQPQTDRPSPTPDVPNQVNRCDASPIGTITNQLDMSIDDRSAERVVQLPIIAGTAAHLSCMLDRNRERAVRMPGRSGRR